MTLNILPRRRSWGFLSHDNLLFMTQAGPVFLFAGMALLACVRLRVTVLLLVSLHRVEATFAFLWNYLDLLN